MTVDLRGDDAFEKGASGEVEAAPLILGELGLSTVPATETDEEEDTEDVEDRRGEAEGAGWLLGRGRVGGGSRFMLLDLVMDGLGTDLSGSGDDSETLLLFLFALDSFTSVELDSSAGGPAVGSLSVVSIGNNPESIRSLFCCCQTKQSCKSSNKCKPKQSNTRESQRASKQRKLEISCVKTYFFFPFFVVVVLLFFILVFFTNWSVSFSLFQQKLFPLWTSQGR